MNLGNGSQSSGWLRRWSPAAAAILLFGSVTVLLLELSPIYLGTRLPSDLGDPLLNLYFLDWGERALWRGLAGFWDANFYFPATGVMTFADHLIGPTIQAALFRLVWDNDVAAYNFLFLGSFVLCGITTAWFMRQAGASRGAATIAGLIFAFIPYRFDQRAHLPMLLTQWIPLVLWHWDRLLGKPGWMPAAAFTAAYVLHVTGGTYLGYFVHLALAVFLVMHWRDWRTWLEPRSLKVLIPVAAICVAVALAVFLPYVRVHDEMNLMRGESEIRHYGASLESYFSIEGSNRLWGERLLRGKPENHMFAGVVTILLATAGMIAAARARWRRREESELPAAIARFDRNVLVMAAFFFLLSFAAIYLPLSRVLPGLAQMRVPTRVYPFIAFALALCAARGVDGLLVRADGARRALAAGAIAIVLVFELRTDMPWLRWPQRSIEKGIDHEIARRPEVRVVLHLPLQKDGWQARYMYFSTLHWKPIANGYSGYEPATYRELVARVSRRPLDDATLDYVVGLGVTHVATHLARRAAPGVAEELAAWARRFAGGPAPRVRLVASAGDDRLYEILPR